MTSTTLHLRLGRENELAGTGEALRTIAPFAAHLRQAPDELTVELALPALSRAELRWGVDQSVRKLSALFNAKEMRLSATEAIDDDTLRTLALDQHHRMKGAVDLSAFPSAVQNDVQRLGAAEDGYRRWVNEDPTLRTSLQIADDVRSWATAQEHVTVDVLEEPALREEGLRLLLAVGGASTTSPPRLVTALYTPPGTEDLPPRMLLGKGITFDTGGINVKPYESFVSHMKNDMAGSALAWWLFRSLVEQGHPRPLVVVLATCENPIGENAMRPGSIVESYRGHRVRIDHTDAEGRLALADGLAYGSDRFQPEDVLCFATLTTAALIAYGPYATPVHFADSALQKRLEEASARTGEDLHFFPERIWHFEANRDLEADLRNTARLPQNASRGAGSRNAGHFLKHFTDTPLVHFDIFASTWNWAGDAPGAGYGATGAPLRTLLTALE